MDGRYLSVSAFQIKSNINKIFQKCYNEENLSCFLISKLYKITLKDALTPSHMAKLLFRLFLVKWFAAFEPLVCSVHHEGIGLSH